MSYVQAYEYLRARLRQLRQNCTVSGRWERLRCYAASEAAPRLLFGKPYERGRPLPGGRFVISEQLMLSGTQASASKSAIQLVGTCAMVQTAPDDMDDDVEPPEQTPVERDPSGRYLRVSWQSPLPAGTPNPAGCHWDLSCTCSGTLD